MDRKRTIMKLSKFRRLVSLMCVVFVMCVIVAPAAAAANYDDQISPHIMACPECNSDMDNITIRNQYDPNIQVGRCSKGIHYFARSAGTIWQCTRCPIIIPITSQTGHYCVGCRDYCFGPCDCLKK